MTQRLVSWLARCLSPQEREAVLGDLAEGGMRSREAGFEIAGLLARRQAALWANWRPWAALCVAVPAGWYLGWCLGGMVIGNYRGLDLWIVLNRRDLDPALLARYGLGVRHAVAALAQGAVLLTGSAWASGVALGWLARRAVWVHAVLFALLVALYPLPLALQNGDFWIFFGLVLTAMLPAALGTRLGCKAAAHCST
jgi:hypothetical protein